MERAEQIDLLTRLGKAMSFGTEQKYVLVLATDDVELLLYIRDAVLNDIGRAPDGSERVAVALEAIGATGSMSMPDLDAEVFAVLTKASISAPVMRETRTAWLEKASRLSTQGYRPTLANDKRRDDERIRFAAELAAECWEEAQPGGARWRRDKVLAWINDRMREADLEPFDSTVGRPLWRAIRDKVPSFYFDYRTMPGQPTGFRPRPEVRDFPDSIRGS